MIPASVFCNTCARYNTVVWHSSMLCIQKFWLDAVAVTDLNQSSYQAKVTRWPANPVALKSMVPTIFQIGFCRYIYQLAV